MRSLSESKTYLKTSASRLMSWKYVVFRILDLSKEVLLVFVGQSAAKLQAVKLSFGITVPSHFF